MSTILVIAGHGENRDGSFDPGAKGYIGKGEHRYYEEDFFKAMRKYLPSGSNVVLFSDYNVYDHKNLVSLARKYGSNTTVVEMHFDASVEAASGGHVIVHENYAPDALDIKIRDVIKKHIGVRYNHKGHQGVSGRGNLYNCNVAANNGLNYRLVELGFGTNRRDANTMVNNIDAIAKDFVKALIGTSTNAPVVSKNESVDKPKPINPSDKSIDALARDVIQGMYGNGDDRKKALGSKFNAVQSRVDELLSGNKHVPNKPNKSIDQLAKEVIDGKHGSGDARRKALGSQYNAVQARVNALLGGSSSNPGKSIDQLAREVIDGKHGTGDARKRALGSNFDAVQAKVNQLLGGGQSSGSGKSIDQLAREVILGKHGSGEARKKSLGSKYNAVQKRVNELM